MLTLRFFTITLLIMMTVTPALAASLPAETKAVSPGTPSSPTEITPNHTNLTSNVEQPAALQGMAPASPSTDSNQPRNMLTLSQSETPLSHNGLKKHCHAVQLKLTNATQDYLEVLQVEVLNAQDAQQVAQQEADASQRRRAMSASLLRMVGGAIPYAGSFGGMAAYQATALTSHMASSTASMITSTNTPAGGTTIHVYQQRINNVVVNPRDSFQFLALLPKTSRAQLKITFKNVKTNEIYSYQTEE